MNGIDGTNLRSRRLLCGLSLAQLGRRAGTSKSHISEIENGKVGVGVGCALQLARALDTTVEALFGGGDVLPIEPLQIRLSRLELAARHAATVLREALEAETWRVS